MGGFGRDQSYRRICITPVITESVGKTKMSEANEQADKDFGSSRCSVAVDVRLDADFYAIMVRSCSVTHAVDTMLFPDVEMAKAFCRIRFGVPDDKWDSYMVASDPKSTMKLNGEGVRYCGWKYDIDETETFHIHLERKVVEF